MFSKKSVIIIGVAVLMIVNLIVLSVAGTHYSAISPRKIMISMVAPFQEIAFQSIRFTKNLWRHYFFLASVARENEALKRNLRAAVEKNKDKIEVELSNSRLRNLLKLKQSINFEMAACEVIAKDPSSVFKTVIIDKGESDGLKVGLPVVAPEGIVGQIIQTAYHYAKVLLVIDGNSAVDAMVQRTRARGMIKGGAGSICRLDYVLWKDDVQIGDVVISSGLDGVFPKGLRLGSVSDIVRQHSGIFQEVSVTSFVNFEKLEEVMVLLNPRPEEPVTE
jgi:rod shape-determining protein MreC